MVLISPFLKIYGGGRRAALLCPLQDDHHYPVQMANVGCGYWGGRGVDPNHKREEHVATAYSRKRSEDPLTCGYLVLTRIARKVRKRGGHL